MIGANMTYLTKTTFAAVEEKIGEFENYLSANSIEPHQGSILAMMIRTSRRIIKGWREQEIAADFPVHDGMTEFSELHYLCDLILEIRGLDFEVELLPKLKVLAKGDPGPLAPGARSRERDTSFEILCASISRRFAKDVRFLEPDVQCQFLNARWGLACKAVYGTDTSAERAIHKGISQITKSNSDYGIIILQLTNVFPHEGMYRRYAGGDIGSDRSREMLVNRFHRLGRLCCEPFHQAAKRAMRHRKDSRVRGVLFLMQSAPYWHGMRTAVSGCEYRSLSPIIGLEEQFFRCFNEHLQQPAMRSAVHALDH